MTRDQTLDDQVDWEAILTRMAPGIHASRIVLSRAQLNRIMSKITLKYEALTGKNYPQVDYLTRQLPPGLTLFGLQVVIDEAIESPTFYANTDFVTGAEQFIEQFNKGNK